MRVSHKKLNFCYQKLDFIIIYVYLNIFFCYITAILIFHSYHWDTYLLFFISQINTFTFILDFRLLFLIIIRFKLFWLLSCHPFFSFNSLTLSHSCHADEYCGKYFTLMYFHWFHGYNPMLIWEHLILFHWTCSDILWNIYLFSTQSF